MFRRRRGSIFASLNEREADLLRGLIAEYRSLLDAPEGSDPVLGRLFPPASVEEPEVAAEYREMAHDELTRHKRRTAEITLALMGESGEWKSKVEPEEQEAFLVLLTDLRLAIGTRLGVTEEMMNQPVEPADPRQWSMAVLHWLGALQESLVEALSQ